MINSISFTNILWMKSFNSYSNRYYRIPRFHIKNLHFFKFLTEIFQSYVSYVNIRTFLCISRENNFHNRNIHKMLIIIVILKSQHWPKYSDCTFFQANMCIHF